MRTVPSLSRQINADRGNLATGVAKLTHLAYRYHATDKRAPCGASHADPFTAAQPTTRLSNRHSDRHRPVKPQGPFIGPILVDSNHQASSASFARLRSADLPNRLIPANAAAVRVGRRQRILLVMPRGRTGQWIGSGEHKRVDRGERHDLSSTTRLDHSGAEFRHEREPFSVVGFATIPHGVSPTRCPLLASSKAFLVGLFRPGNTTSSAYSL